MEGKEESQSSETGCSWAPEPDSRRHAQTGSPTAKTRTIEAQTPFSRPTQTYSRGIRGPGLSIDSNESRMAGR